MKLSSTTFNTITWNRKDNDHFYKKYKDIINNSVIVFIAVNYNISFTCCMIIPFLCNFSDLRVCICACVCIYVRIRKMFISINFCFLVKCTFPSQQTISRKQTRIIFLTLRVPLYVSNVSKYLHPYASVFVLYTWNSDEKVRNVRRIDTKRIHLRSRNVYKLQRENRFLP